MKTKISKLRLAVAAAALSTAALGAIGTGAAIAQDDSFDLTVLQPIPKNFDPPKTAWGDPDLRGTWPIDNIASLPLQRPANYGDRFYLTDEEFAQRQAQSDRSDQAYDAEDEQGKIGMGHWVESDSSGRRTSLLVEPANGQLPAMTEKAQQLYNEGRSSWKPNQPFDWVTDFDSWDRCVSRGFPASMLPFRYNNGIRIFQAPGHVVIDLEMIHDSRVIPVAKNKAEYAELEKTRWPDDVRTWMGQSLGYWDGNTLVIETTNIVAGDSATYDSQARSASPLNMATMGVPPFNTIPMSEQAKVVETLTMTGPDSISYEMGYSDPETFVAPWKARLDWTRNEDYGFYEYACHEGNVQVRNYINSSRAERGMDTSGVGIHSGNSAPGGE
jgi:hypothetical protein